MILFSTSSMLSSAVSGLPNCEAANTDWTGAYMTVQIEVVLNRLINKMFMHEGDNEITTPEPMLLNKIHKVKVTVENEATFAITANLTMGLYRQQTA